MLIETPKRLPKELDIPCYACEKHLATHVCRYKIGELAIQVCLCAKCMKIDTKRLLKNTVGIKGIFENATGNYMVEGSGIKSGLSSEPAL